MLESGRSFSVGRGLDIWVADSLGVGARPRAVISIQPIIGALEQQGTDCAVSVRVSAGRLRVMLGNVPIVEALLDRLSASQESLLEISNHALVYRIADEIRRCSHKGATLHLYLQSKVIELLVEVLSQPIYGNKHPQAIAVRDILLAAPASPPSMADLSRMVGLPPRKLSAQFRAAFGKPVLEWLADWRLVRARELVIDGGISIKDIAFSLGYSHVATFSTAFTRRFGVPPTQLRASVKLEHLP